MKIVEVVLRFAVDDSVSPDRAASFASEAVEMWGGQYRPPGAEGDADPGDPLFGIREVEIVRAKRFARPPRGWRAK